LRFHGTDQPLSSVHLGVDRETLKQLAILLRGMDDLWSLVQTQFCEDLYE
jgi:thiamine kinase